MVAFILGGIVAGVTVLNAIYRYEVWQDFRIKITKSKLEITDDKATFILDDGTYYTTENNYLWSSNTDLDGNQAKILSEVFDSRTKFLSRIENYKNDQRTETK